MKEQCASYIFVQQGTPCQIYANPAAFRFHLEQCCDRVGVPIPDRVNRITF